VSYSRHQVLNGTGSGLIQARSSPDLRQREQRTLARQRSDDGVPRADPAAPRGDGVMQLVPRGTCGTCGTRAERGDNAASDSRDAAWTSRDLARTSRGPRADLARNAARRRTASSRPTTQQAIRGMPRGLRGTARTSRGPRAERGEEEDGVKPADDAARDSRHPATSRDIPRHPATSRDIPRHPATSRDIPRHPATSRDIPRHPATSRDIPRHPATSRDIPRHPAASAASPGTPAQRRAERTAAGR
jgi:hypothetical protein